MEQTRSSISDGHQGTDLPAHSTPGNSDRGSASTGNTDNAVLDPCRHSSAAAGCSTPPITGDGHAAAMPAPTKDTPSLPASMWRRNAKEERAYDVWFQLSADRQHTEIALFDASSPRKWCLCDQVSNFLPVCLPLWSLCENC